MKTKVSVCSVATDWIGVRIDEETNTTLLMLTPAEAYDVIRIIQDGLFKWHELTRKKIDEGNPT